MFTALAAWYLTGNWLENYAFRISISRTWDLWPFLLLIAVAVLTVSFQSVRGALANPVRSLSS